MRNKGKGQQFDRLWNEANTLIERSLDSVDNALLDDISDLIDKVSKKIPTSDYEIKDKDNLIEQLSLAFQRVIKNQYDEYLRNNYVSFKKVRFERL